MEGQKNGAVGAQVIADEDGWLIPLDPVKTEHGRFAKKEPEDQSEQWHGGVAWPGYTSCLFWKALARVTSSAYSKAAPMGMPWAILVTLIPEGFKRRAI